MKKRITRTTDPLDRPVDFTRFGPVRRNAFAGAGEPGGPSLLALWEMPQLATGAVALRRGRPAKGPSRTSTVRSVRLPDALWKELERARFGVWKWEISSGVVHWSDHLHEIYGLRPG